MGLLSDPEETLRPFGGVLAVECTEQEEAGGPTPSISFPLFLAGHPQPVARFRQRRQRGSRRSAAAGAGPAHGADLPAAVHRSGLLVEAPPPFSALLLTRECACGEVCG